MQRFAGKRILITGGSSGIGLATAKRIVAEGGEVAVTGHSQDHLNEAGSVLPAGSLVLRNDASDPEAAIVLADKVKEKMGVLDGVYLNAGYGTFKPTEDVDAEFFDAMNDTNVRGPILQMAKLQPLIADGGSVLVTSSVAAYLGHGSVYAATKAALTAIARAWSNEYASRNIRVNAVAPGPIETNFINKTGMDEDQREEFAEEIRKQVPLGRFGKAEEVAAVAAFLLSEDASYVTGSEYFVDGGMTKR
ncbi:SDR family oxidoreductase [Parvularcula sp. LCG005]|uniref:SDR family oxidoreductase n=1 Tax=Parvularcula sp. LCG005 TaxID=3078805 RepID=UPI00294231EB|nr:SDR family oxidoreductase [Parvularcula sp. LCG005]WOI52320.1 SDR family oxidoreductase [Parvularcula sp. LCG005]